MAFKGFIVYAACISIGLATLLATGVKLPSLDSGGWGSTTGSSGYGSSGYRGSGGSFSWGGGK